MRPVVVTQEGFAAGELGRRWRGRRSTPQYAQGLALSENWWPLASGSLRGRPGFAYPDPPLGQTIAAPARLAPLPGGPGIVHDQRVKVGGWDGAALSWEDDLASVWTASHLDSGLMDWHRSEWWATMVTHPDLPPQQVVLEPYGMWRSQSWVYDTTNKPGGLADGSDGVYRHQPYFKVARPTASLSAAADSGNVYTFTSNQPVFGPGHAGTRLRFKGVEAGITGIASDGFSCAAIPQDEAALTSAGLEATFDWAEQLNSPVNGYFTSTATFAGRLWGVHNARGRIVICGSRVGRPFNFEVGNGEADEAIIEEVLGLDAGERALYLRPWRDTLLLFTTHGVWEIGADGGAGLTPTTVRAGRLVRIQVGAVQPVRYQSTYLFVGADRKTLHELRYSRERGGYFSRPLTDTIQHRITGIRALVRIPDTVGGGADLIGVVDDSGAVLVSTLRGEVPGWHVWTAGIGDALLYGDTVFALVDRGAGYVVERLTDAAFVDAFDTREAEVATTTFTGFDHLEGVTLNVWADGVYEGPITVAAGEITVSSPTTTLETGLTYTAKIGLLPPAEAWAGREPLIGVQHHLDVSGLDRIPLLNDVKLDTAIVDGVRYTQAELAAAGAGTGLFERDDDGATLEPILAFGPRADDLEVNGRVSLYKVGDA